MSLSHDLISQFVKATKDDKKTPKEATVYGTVVYDGRPYVKLDGSDLLTPVSTTTNIEDGERVTVLIKDHSAVITGNITSPAARTDEVKEVVDVMAYSITAEELNAISATIGDLRAASANITDLEAVNALIESLDAKYANLDKVTAKDVDAIYADIESLKAIFGEFTDISAEELDAVYAEIDKLEAYTADFTYVSADHLTAIKAEVDSADVKYANIDFSNIGVAAIEEFFTKTGMIENVVIGDSTITGALVGVTIKGDLIEGSTVKADKLVVKGSDGLYYKLNFESGTFVDGEAVPEDSLHGSVITAKSITAEKVSVKDLVAFGADIGGFKITDTAIHSVTKDSVYNTTRGVYLDNEGQISLGDDNNYLKYYQDENGKYHLDISAATVRMSTTGVGIDEHLQNEMQSEFSKWSKYITFSENGIEISAGNNTMSIKIDNDLIRFEKDGVMYGWWDGTDFHTGNIMVDVQERAQFGNFAFIPRNDGSLSFLQVRNTAGFNGSLKYGILSLYGSYPAMTDTTLTFTDVTGSLTGTTLMLEED